jgi:Septum formation initiator
VSLAVAIVILATQFPLSQLFHGRATLAHASHQLAELQAENRALGGELSSLRSDDTVARIAHEEYGLVLHGERSVVVLPSPGATGVASGPLAETTVPRADLVPSDAIVSSTAPAGPRARTPGFWSRVLGRLEFWKALP